MNPFDWTGPEFLGFYYPLLIVGTIVVWNVRQMLRTPWSAPPESPDLSPYQAAYLAGGPWRAFAAALTRLFQCGAAVEQSGTFRRTDALPANANPLERAVWDRAGRPARVDELFAAATDELEQIRQSLLARGLVLSDATSRVVRLVPFFLMLAISLFGLIKICVGVQRDKPVAFLIIGTVISAIAGFAFLAIRLLRSRRGDAVLRELQQKHDALGATARTSPAALAASDLPLAVALFGTAALAAPAYAALQGPLGPRLGGQGGTGGSCGSGCGSGGSSCGGGSGCGGGGGGGGCGGCGGGGGD
jgi:uncharacterized protein (TIGR04222 family)